ncbi:MAG: Ldh family oxidoreductase [Pseudomonadota bacterium]
MKITIKELKTLTENALKNQGYNDEEIPVISDALLYAQLRGNNQGVVKLIGAGMPKSPDAGEMKIVKETPISARIDGNCNQAMVVMKKAVQITLEKARKSGFGIVGTFNTSTSSGAIGHYTSQLAEQGFIGFAFARSPERVAAHGSYEPVFGTDPLSIAIPAKPMPLVFDMSTAAISFFGLIEANTAGKPIADDLVYDANGNPTTDPGMGMKGAIRSFDRGFKGTALGMMAEILAGPLVGAAFSGIGDSKKNWGHLIFAIDPDLLGDRKTFIRNVAQMIEKVKNSKKLPNVQEILVPGERGGKIVQKALETGEIEIEDNLLKGLKKAADC